MIQSDNGLFAGWLKMSTQEGHYYHRLDLIKEPSIADWNWTEESKRADYAPRRPAA